MNIVNVTREDRVQSIMIQMREGMWIRGGSGKNLAALWGLSEATIKEYAAEAWRRVKAEVTDRGRIQVDAISRLERAAEAAETNAALGGRDAVQERKALIAACDSLLRFASSTTDEPANWETLTTEEKWGKLDEAQSRIDAMKALLPPRGGG